MANGILNRLKVHLYYRRTAREPSKTKYVSKVFYYRICSLVCDILIVTKEIKRSIRRNAILHLSVRTFPCLSFLFRYPLHQFLKLELSHSLTLIDSKWYLIPIFRYNSQNIVIHFRSKIWLQSSLHWKKKIVRNERVDEASIQFTIRTIVKHESSFYEEFFV